MNSKREITLDNTLILIGWMFENGDGLSGEHNRSTPLLPLDSLQRTSLCLCGGADVPKNWRTRPPERSLSVVLVQVISRRPLVTSPLSKRGEHGLSLESHKA